MATMHACLLARLSELSSKICEFKAAALATERAVGHHWVLPDGSVSRVHADGARWMRYEYVRVTRWMNPREPNWTAYQYARCEAALCFTALAMLKCIGVDAGLAYLKKKNALSSFRAYCAQARAAGRLGVRVDARHVARAWRRLKRLDARSRRAAA